MPRKPTEGVDDSLPSEPEETTDTPPLPPPPEPKQEDQTPAWYDAPWIRNIKLSTLLIVAGTIGATIHGCWTGQGPPAPPTEKPAAEEPADTDWPESPF